MINQGIELDMSDPESWTVDTVHLGTQQLEIGYDPEKYHH